MNQKRRNLIVKMIEEQQAITNQEIMERFDISIETVRRDLAYLEKQGVITRVYGGAVKKEVVRTEDLYTNREQENSTEKKLIAEAAENLIEPNDIVFFDLGTTVELVAQKLQKSKKVYAFTNAIRTAVTLSERCDEVILTGGRIRPGELSLSGTLAEISLSKFNINIAIIGAAGANLNPEREFPSMFEPIHGSAPDIAGKNISNPLATFWSVSQMLDFFGYTEWGKRVIDVIEEMLVENKTLTPDLGGSAKTYEVGEAFIKKLLS